MEINGRKAKPATPVRIGDRLQIRKERYRYQVEVLEVREKRVSADLARSMYRESEQSIADREALAQMLEGERRAVKYDDGRPSKRDRRSMERLKRFTE